MPLSSRTLLLVSLTLPLSAAPQTLPPTPNQAATESRREIENSRREARENLERGRRGEIDPREIRRAREAGPAESSTLPPEVIARWQATPPQRLGTDPDFVRAMQNENLAALAHWEGVLMEMNRDLRDDAGSRRWLGAPVLIPDQDSVLSTVGERPNQPPARRGVKRKPAEEKRQDDAPRRKRNPIHERDALERDRREAGRQYAVAMRRRDDNPGNQELIRLAEHEATRVRLAEERYQAFLRENMPDDIARASNSSNRSMGVWPTRACSIRRNCRAVTNPQSARTPHRFPNMRGAWVPILAIDWAERPKAAKALSSPLAPIHSLLHSDRKSPGSRNIARLQGIRPGCVKSA